MTARAVQPRTKRKRRLTRVRRLLETPAIKKAKRARKAKFVLVYQGLTDPDATIVKQIVDAFSPATVKEVFPGTLKIEGDGRKIKQRATALDSWSLAPEGVASSRSPSQTRFDHA